jgi:tetraacyldisaccharide 4'-kinase
VVIARAADRVAGAQAAIEEYGCDTLIMDDGYQHVRLARDENVCIIDASNPWGGGQLVPRGPLREPLTALSRATHLLLTRCDQVGNLDGLIEELKERCGDIPIRYTRHAPDGFYRMATGEAVNIEDIKNARARVICGIGRPQAFHRTLLDLGLDVPEPRVFADHEVIRLDKCTDADYIIVTEKDAVKLDANDDRIVMLRVALQDFRPE